MKKPMRLPASTWGNVCPLISLTGLNGICRRFESLAPNAFKDLAWTPAARRTPIASRMTTSEKKNDNTNTSEFTPLECPIDVVIAMTNALWLEGIPPVLQTSVDSISLNPALRFVSNIIKAFTN